MLDKVIPVLETSPLDAAIKQAGRIHSIETCGTVDGPGIRFVIFTQGCPLRCQYCHNPDCRHWADGQPVTTEELMQQIGAYRYYIRPPGGVTISGGEPLMQPYFVKEVLQRCQQLGLHTALDTSGYCNLLVAQDVLNYVDLVLLDIKSFDPAVYMNVTGVDVTPTLRLAQYLSEINKPTWIRFVLVPGLTDDPQNIAGLAQFVATLDSVERVEILPFHKMGEYKWKQLGYDYQLQDTLPPSPELIQQTVDRFKAAAQGKYDVLAADT
ncbi:MAG: pyruvate formate-lyase-activating protein [Leptolyngbyaceae cyanobacterium bins.349]|nr:pyruvate formate-lyase-activating protein [Leptolyngbyaceae cyanobacterium bins.349]